MNTKNTLYLDMDGVLVDFETGYKKLSKGISIKQMNVMYGNNKAKELYHAAGKDFWANLNWIIGGKEIFNTAIQLFRNVYILSSSGTQDSIKGNLVKQGKLEWIKKNIPSFNLSKVIVVNGRHNKQNYSNVNSILVDDMPDSINQWNSKGGTGILHDFNFYLKTIDELENLAGHIKLSKLLNKS